MTAEEETTLPPYIVKQLLQDIEAEDQPREAIEKGLILCLPKRAKMAVASLLVKII